MQKYTFCTWLTTIVPKISSFSLSFSFFLHLVFSGYHIRFIAKERKARERETHTHKHNRYFSHRNYVLSYQLAHCHKKRTCFLLMRIYVEPASVSTLTHPCLHFHVRYVYTVCVMIL